ncbi:MAG: transcriptional repressor [Bacteroidales bacterium]|jgi:Fur family peroxide stress response transcriptional regulator
MDKDEIRHTLMENGLKITPQRLAIFEAVTELDNHPTADNIIQFIKDNHPNIAVGTVYNILEVFVEKGIIRKVKTDKDIMRYDAITENHHHLYSIESDRIEDYFDDELNEVIRRHFKKKEIPNFRIDDIKLQIIGKFINKQ